jgi:hypothetical protein
MHPDDPDEKQNCTVEDENQKPEIPAQIEIMRKEILRINSLVSALGKALSSVMSQDVGDDKSRPYEAPQTPLGEDLHFMATEAERIGNYVESLLARLAL